MRLFFCALLCLVACEYTEDLLIKQLTGKSLFMQFQFTNQIPLNNDLDTWEERHFSHFPPVIAQLVQTTKVQEFHLSFSHGQRPDESIYPGVPSGADMSAWFSKKRNVDESWNKFTHSMAGIFCASLNEMDSSRTVEPVHSFKPEGDLNALLRENLNDYVVKYSTLPREVTCTENLTPWLKLLPCKSKSGLASLLNPIKIFNAPFFAMSSHLRVICQNEECSMKNLEFIQGLSFIADLHTGFWNIQSVLGRRLVNSCQVSQHTKIMLQTSDVSNLNIPPTYMKKIKEKQFAVYEKELISDTIGLKQSEQPDSDADLFKVTRVQSGFGRERSAIKTTIRNNSSHSIPIVYLENVRWLMRFYLHTFKAYSGSGKDLRERNDLIHTLAYSPSKDRVAPGMIEAVIVIPANSVVTLRFDFDIGLLKFDESPGDAERGLDINPAIISVDSQYLKKIVPGGIDWIRDSDSGITRIATSTLILPFPIVDDTMPYNVITLTCTVMAIFYGSVFNIFFRRFYLLKKTDHLTMKQKIMRFIRMRLLKQAE